MIRVLLVDDEELVRSGLRLILSTEPDLDVVAEAADGEQALALAELHRPDVVMLDIRMPGLDGIEVARRLAASGSPARVVVLTTFDNDELRVRRPAGRSERVPPQGRSGHPAGDRDQGCRCG